MNNGLRFEEECAAAIQEQVNRENGEHISMGEARLRLRLIVSILNAINAKSEEPRFLSLRKVREIAVSLHGIQVSTGNPTQDIFQEISDKAEIYFLETDANNRFLKIEKNWFLGSIKETTRCIIEEEGKTRYDAEFLAIVALLEDLQERPRSQFDRKIIVDIVANEYSQHNCDVLTFLAWRDKAIVLKPEFERKLIERLKVRTKW